MSRPSESEAKVELIDMIYHYGRNRFAEIDDVFSYGSSFLLSNPMSDLTHVIMCQSMNMKFQVMGKIQGDKGAFLPFLSLVFLISFSCRVARQMDSRELVDH